MPQPAFTLLYVEDDEITRDTVRTLLGRRFPELTIRGAADGAEGLRLFGELGPDLVVTDIRMPELDGIEMSRRILALNPAVPIIVTSAHSEAADLIESIEIGISRYVMKPIDGAKLFQAVEGCLGSLRLASERERSAREIELLNRTLSARARELEIANRDMEGFSYTVSHDLRTPLSTINGYCQLILELYGAGLDEQCRGFVDMVLGETLHMNQLISTLLDFSRASRAEISRKPTELSRTAEVIAAGLLLREPGRGVEFRIEPAMAADGDPELLRVVLDNLLGNAFKYTAQKEEALIEFGVANPGGESAYFVRDNGAGFDMAQAGRLFQPFQRLHAERGFSGFGIGLATVQRIVERHGGRIWAEARVEKGATFYFTLPKRPEERYQ